MTHSERNRLFEEKEHLICMTMNKHSLLIYICHMDKNDVYQELAVRMLEALEKYDPAKCKSLEAYLMQRLKYRILQMKDGSKLYNMPFAPQRGFSVLSLDAPDRFGNALDPQSYYDYRSPIWIENEIDNLPEKQRTAVNNYLSGKRMNCRNKALVAAREHFRAMAG